MNRALRRQQARSDKSGKPFNEVFKTFERGSKEQPDRTLEQWCWLHNTRWEDSKHPTGRDKAKADEIRLKPFKRYEDGKLIMGRICGKCGNQVLVDSKRAQIHQGLEGATDKKTDEVNLDYGVNI